MNWTTVLEVVAGALLLVFVMLRAERKRWWFVALVFVLPLGWLGVIWANAYGLWPEMSVGLIIAGLITGAWWFAYGRKLLPPTTDNIRVWGQDDAPKPKPAQLQAEVQQLREEKTQLEAELQRLKTGKNGQNGHD